MTARFVRRWLTPLAGYVAAALVTTWPVALHPFARLGAPVGPGDPFLNLWILGWDLRTLSAHPLAIVTGRVFDANIFFPARQTLAYSDHLLLQAFPLWPIYGATHDVVFCYNVLLVGSLVAAALAMHAFARQVSGSEAGAWAAGLVWGFCSFHFAHLLHLQLQALYFLPLTFLFLHRLVAAGRSSDAVALGVAAGLQAIGSVYFGVIGAVALVVAAAVLAFVVGRWRSLHLLRRLLMAAAVGAALVAPFVWPYWQVQQREGFTRNLYEASHHEASAVSYLRAAPVNLLYGSTGWLRPSPVVPSGGASWREGPEQELFVPFAAYALACLGLVRARRRDNHAAAYAFAAVAAVGFLLSLGPDGSRALYSTLHRFVFGFQAIRAPARFGVLVAFGTSSLAAFGMRELWQRHRVAGGLAAALLVIELLNVPLPVVAAPGETAIARWLRDAPGPGAVAVLPLSFDAANTVPMVQSLVHGRPLVNGYSGQQPASFPAIVEALSTWPSAEALWTLHDLGVRFVVVPSELDKPVPAAAAAAVVRRAMFDEGSIDELRWTPEIEASLARPDLPAPPEAGPAPFAPGETLRYRVAWVGGAGGLDLDAGRATFTVLNGQGSAPGEEAVTASRYRFALSVETAAWVSSFFEARDRFDTWVDGRLLPLVHEQHLEEGRRRITRVTLFDQAQRRLRTGLGSRSAVAEAISLPMGPGTRDPLAAFFYARTLALVPGTSVRVPVTDNGRSLIVDLHAAGIEPVRYGGTGTAALRVDVQVSYRIQRRQAPRATIWLSQDGRRIPLVIAVDAGFGSFRAELTNR